MRTVVSMILAFCLGSLVLCACERHMSGNDPPMRPLIYTELPPSAQAEEEEIPPVMINIAPEDLGYALFHAFVDHDRDAYESMFISGEELSTLIHMPLEGATKQAAEIVNKSEVLWTLFAPTLEAEEPIGGLSTRLRLAEFRLGKGRNLAGKLATPELDDLIQHWGNELRIELIDSSKTFTIRIPKIVKTPQGWRIAAAIEMDKTLQLFLETGMHLKTDLITSEHYPMPLEVGNFWKYKITKTLTTLPTDPLVESADPTVTDMITDIYHRQGYWIVFFERTTVDPQVQDAEGPDISRFAWFVTPRMIFPCMRDCQNNADNISYLLGYLMRQTPYFVFPIEVGQKWSTSGQPSNYFKYEVRALHQEQVVVPGGAFSGTYEIFGSIEEGRESRYFVPGTGIIMRTVRSGAGQRTETLIKHRLIL